MASDGGPAFPWIDPYHTFGLPTECPGMSLLDWFAGQALAGIECSMAIDSRRFDLFVTTAEIEGGTIAFIEAREAYEIAAAMLAERERRMNGADDATT